MFSVGIDTIEISRFAKLRFLPRASEFFLTPKELARASTPVSPLQFFASRFAAKEAVIKAIPETVTYHDLEIVKDGRRPSVKFLKPGLNKYKVALSFSHSEQSAIAIAIAEF